MPHAPQRRQHPAHRPRLACWLQGPADLAVRWFSNLGFPLPYGVNVAEHILDLAAGEGNYTSSAVGKAGREVAMLRAGSLDGPALEMVRAASGEIARTGAGSAAAGAAAAGGRKLSVDAPPGVSGAPAVAALWRTMEAFVGAHPGGLEAGNDAWQRAELLTAERRQAAAEAAAGDAAAGGGLHRRPSAAAGGLAPEMRREISRVFSLARSAPGAPPATRLAVKFGLMDRGGASYGTQLRVLFNRCIKVRTAGGHCLTCEEAGAAWLHSASRATPGGGGGGEPSAC